MLGFVFVSSSFNFMSSGRWLLSSFLLLAQIFYSGLVYSQITERSQPVEASPLPFSRERLKALDQYARDVPRSYESDTRHLLSYLLKPAHNDYEKVRLVYSWLISHVAYAHGAHLGDDFFSRGSLSGLTHQGLACDGYGLIFQRLAAEAGLEVKAIEGFARDGEKRPVAKPNHLWDAVKVNGSWWLVDPTWAAGSVNGSTFKSDPDDYFFLAPLDAFSLSHFDFKDEFGTQQRLGLSWRDFEALPADAPDLVYAGFSVRQILSYVDSHKHQNTVRTFNQPAGLFDAHLMPLGSTVKRSQKVHFSIDSDYYSDLVIVQGKQWTSMTRNGSKFEINPELRPGNLMIMGRPKHGSEYEALLEYHVQ